MAARRSKSQARRNDGSGMPGWAWMVLGIVLTLLIVLVAPKYMESADGDGFFRPQPDPDARPAPSRTAEDALPTPAAPVAAAPPAGESRSDDGYTFYEVLSGKEVPMTDAELAATQRAEAEREAALAKAREAQPSPEQSPATLPQPVEPDPATPARTGPDRTVAAGDNPRTAAGVGDGSRYLLQAGAFQASGQAEELKAKIAMLGLGARVESAQSNGRTVYRVRMGPYGTAGDLADAKQKLENGGIEPLAIKVQ